MAPDPSAAVKLRGARTSPATSTDDLVATLPGIVWEADGTTYAMTYLSPRARDILGHDPETWLSTPEFWEDHLHPEDRVRAIEAVERAVAELATTTVAYRFRAADGEYHHFRDVIRVIDHADGHRYLVGFMFDVSGEASVEAQRRLLAAAVEVARDGILILDAEGRVVYVNPAVERAGGIAAADVVGRSARALVDFDLDAAGPELLAAMRAGDPWTGDVTAPGPDGTARIADISIAPVRDEAGSLTHWVLITRDVTAERAARRATARLAAIVESAADAGYANDIDGTYVAWNDAAERIYGWTRDDVLGRKVYDLAPEAAQANVRAWFGRIARGETIGPVDTVHTGRDGRRLTLSVTATPVYDEAGRVTAVATIARDVSLERRLAAERLTLETELLQAQKLEAVGRLAGGVAHDFNNMLTAILGYAGMVAADLDGELLESQRQVLHAAERAAELTRRLLAFTRPTALHARPVAIDVVLDDAYRMVRRLVPERIELTLAGGADAFVLADPVEIEQVLLNLVLNAADAITGTGGVRVTTTRVDGRSDAGTTGPGVAGRWVLLRVVDTGAGMDDATRARIFEPFFSTKEFGGGTGLGLATVHAIVRRAGGTVDVRSTPGCGTTFDILLPEVDPPAAAEEPALLPVVSGSERVLVVDDAELVGALAARMLRAAGYEVILETRPEDVLARPPERLDAIVTDVVMPGMSGPEMVRRLGADVPVVFMSGYMADHQSAGLDLGPRRVLIQKPFDARDLPAALRLVLDGGVPVATAEQAC